MRRLCPHFQRAHDMMTRLKAAGNRREQFENTLDWLADGVALLRADGRVVYVNDTLREMARRDDGIRITDCTIEFAARDARHHFGAAFHAVERIGTPFFDAWPTDFPVPRSGGKPAYIVSVRPLVPGQMRNTRHADAVVVVLIRDPLGCTITAGLMLQELFSLTHAEAHLAQALCSGVTTGAYAKERHVTLNTVYSHLRRIREKTGCKSVPELIRRFGEMNVPLRLG
jgi:DNA-binding CsgD family transcriptional regulator